MMRSVLLLSLGLIFTCALAWADDPSSITEHEGESLPNVRLATFGLPRDGDADLYVMNADGTGVRQLTNSPGYDGGPFFSPDGNWVIFRSDRDKKDMLQLFAISTDGKTEVQLTDNPDQVNWCPYFHPT